MTCYSYRRSPRNAINTEWTMYETSNGPLWNNLSRVLFLVGLVLAGLLPTSTGLRREPAPGDRAA